MVTDLYTPPVRHTSKASSALLDVPPVAPSKPLLRRLVAAAVIAGALIVCMTATASASVEAAAAFDNHNTDDSTPRQGVAAKAQAGTGKDFFDRPLGSLIENICTGIAAVGGVVAVVYAATKGVFRKGGSAGVPGGAGATRWLKELIGPLLGCVILLRLGWTFDAIDWAGNAGEAAWDEIGTWLNLSNDSSSS